MIGTAIIIGVVIGTIAVGVVVTTATAGVAAPGRVVVVALAVGPGIRHDDSCLDFASGAGTRKRRGGG